MSLVASIGLFTLGAYGMITRRDLLRILISAILLFAGVTVLGVTLATQATAPTVQSIILLAWAVESIEIIIAISLFVRLARHGDITIDSMRDLRW